ncbi:unnamed protein product, partial [Symbiodinium sp. CCMP2592]
FREPSGTALERAGARAPGLASGALLRGQEAGARCRGSGCNGDGLGTSRDFCQACADRGHAQHAEAGGRHFQKM